MIVIRKAFVAYPGGIKRSFTVGETVTDLPAGEERLYVNKKLAAAVSSKAGKKRDSGNAVE